MNVLIFLKYVFSTALLTFFVCIFGIPSWDKFQAKEVIVNKREISSVDIAPPALTICSPGGWKTSLDINATDTDSYEYNNTDTGSNDYGVGYAYESTDPGTYDNDYDSRDLLAGAANKDRDESAQILKNCGESTTFSKMLLSVSIIKHTACLN